MLGLLHLLKVNHERSYSPHSNEFHFTQAFSENQQANIKFSFVASDCRIRRCCICHRRRRRRRRRHCCRRCHCYRCRCCCCRRSRYATQTQKYNLQSASQWDRQQGVSNFFEIINKLFRKIISTRFENAKTIDTVGDVSSFCA